MSSFTCSASFGKNGTTCETLIAVRNFAHSCDLRCSGAHQEPSRSSSPRRGHRTKRLARPTCGGPDVPAGTLNLSGGASLSINTDSDVDGKWTEFDGAALNLDNATLTRTRSGSSNSGGAFILGSWRSYENQVISLSLTNGSKIDNHGQLWFGAWDDNAVGLQVNMTINDGHLDLKGGFDHNLGPNDADADLVFINGWQDFDAENGGVGMAKGEKYSINFTGPGSIKVSEAGIINPVQNEFGEYDGDTDVTPVTYQDLWNRGILQAHGFSGFKGAKFDGFFTVDGESGFDDYELTSNVTTPIPVVWDGGDGEWNDVGGKWNGGMTANEVLGRTNGLEVGSGEVGFGVHIDSGNVTYDPNNFGDLRFRAGGSLNLSGGSKLTLDSSMAADGNWTQFDGQAINIDNATLSRTQSGDSLSGGAFILGSWRSYDDQSIEVNLTNGGKIENHGQVWFGAWGDNAPGLEVIVTFDDGHLDLTGGDTYDLLTGEEGEVGPGNADLIFINGYADGAPKDENYVLNFVGPGSITVDKAGILNPVADGDDSNPESYGASLTTLLSYEDLWNVGILQANGMSGLDGAAFADFFSTTGAAGADDYVLMSLIGGLLNGDFDGDGSLGLGDIDLISAAILGGGTDASFDLTSDSIVNQADVDAFLGLANRLAGDLDFNGEVAFPDFLVLSSNFGQSGKQWSEGNLVVDGSVGFPDFLVLSNNFGQTSGAAAAAVPEPSGLILLLFAGLGFAAKRRPRRK